MTNVLFTGLTGFLGKNFLNYAKNLTLFPLPCDVLASQGKLTDFNYHFTKDELNQAGIKDIDVVVHAGAFSPKTRGQMNETAPNLQNITNTHYLMEHLPNKPKRIIYISSISAYDLNHLTHIDEATPTASDSLYGLSKLAGEKIVQNYCSEQGIECQILRLGVMYGNNLGYSGLIPTFIQNVLDNNPLTIFGDGAIQKNFIYVEDVCRTIYQAIVQEKVSFPIVNVVNHKNITLSEIVNILKKLHPTPITIEHKENMMPIENLVFDTSVLKQFFLDDLTSYEKGIEKSYTFFKEMK